MIDLLCFYIKYPTLRRVSDTLTYHNYNKGTENGHYPGQFLGKVPCPTVQADIFQMVFFSLLFYV